MAIFEGDPSGSPNKNYVVVISDRNFNVCVRDPWGIPPFLTFNTATIWGHAHDDAHWYVQKSRGILMISYLLWDEASIAPVNACMGSKGRGFSRAAYAHNGIRSETSAE